MKLIWASAFSILLFGVTQPGLKTDSPNLDSEINPNSFERKLLSQAIFEASNQARIERGLKAFKADPVLDTAANYQAFRMWQEGKMEHEWRLDKRFGRLGRRVSYFGGGFRRMAENIARNFILKVESGEYYFPNKDGSVSYANGEIIPNKTYRQLGNDAVKDWLESPGHRRNLLGDFDYMGVGVSPLQALKKGPNFDVYLCQNFGSK